MKNILKVNDSFKEIGTRTIAERNRLTVGEILKGCKRIRLYRNDSGEVLLQPIAEQSTPAAYRVFWYYGPEENRITVIAITPHP